MYESVKTCVRINGECTDYFECTEGLRQGCLLSPVLFSMFVNEFTKIIETCGLCDIQLFPELIELFLLLFADDIALLSDTKSGLQGQLSLLSPFCKEYIIRVHKGKTKIVVFRKGVRLCNTERWTYNGQNIEVISSFQYVGLLLTQKCLSIK